MKSSTQMVVFLVLLVVIVFAVTFASMYVRQTSTKPTTKGDGNTLSLTFARRSYPTRNLKDPPEMAETPLVSEFGARAHFDFWFSNDNAEEVRVGLQKKNCTCSDVKLFVAADDWRRQLAATVEKRSGLMANLVLPAVVSAGAGDSAWHDLGDKDGVVVPAHAVGFVRLSWEGRRGTAGVQGQNLNAELWAQSRGSAVTPLTVSVLLVDPIHVDESSVAVEPLGTGDSNTATVRCWSSTRTDFDLEVRSADNPLIDWRKEPLTEADAGELWQTGKPVLSGWRILVTVHERSKDGKRRFDAGPFIHTLTLVPANIRTEHLEVAVKGTVRGDVAVEGGEVIGIGLGRFEARSGTSRQVKLTSKRRELNLKLHSYPPFMKVSLDKEGPGKWRLTLVIEPNKVSGSFPRADNDAYRDPAIYLKIEGENGRRMRIPVFGEASQ